VLEQLFVSSKTEFAFLKANFERGKTTTSVEKSEYVKITGVHRGTHSGKALHVRHASDLSLETNNPITRGALFCHPSSDIPR
jgi:hypothetical protein